MSTQEAGDGQGISRRRLLGYAGAGGAMIVFRDALALQAFAQGQIVQPGQGTFTVVARRREDFLSLTFELLNLRLDNSKPKRLVKTSPNQPAYIVAVLPPQHLSDESRQVADLQPPGEVAARLAGPTRLAFEVPPTVLPMAFDLETLLHWTVLPQYVVPAAGLDTGATVLREPASHETALELPWHLVLSPRPDAGWAHARTPVTHGERTELWHTRLGTRIPLHFNQQGQLVLERVDESDPAKRTVRAVWARDPGFSPVSRPAAEDPGPRFSLNSRDRWNIVGLSARVAGRRPVAVNRLMLSALGGWLDARGSWDPEGDYSLEDWLHRATMGRDSYVRTVDRGYLMPFGHKAAYIEIDERQFRTVPGHPQGAYLVRRSFVVVREPLKEYGVAKAPHQPKDGRGFPFRSVRIATVVTPDLKTPADRELFRPFTEGEERDVLFDCIGVDWEGQATEFATRMVFVGQAAAFGNPVENTPPTPPDTILSTYNKAMSRTLRAAPAHGQKVAFAPATEAGDTSFPVAELVFQVQGFAYGTQQDLQSKLNELKNFGQAPFYPVLEDAKVQLSAVADTAGKLLGDLISVKLDQAFVDWGLPGMALPDITDVAELAKAAGEHAGELFLGLVNDVLPDLSFGSSDKAGGIATPNLTIAALSRALGPVGGVVEDLRAGKFDPKQFFDPAAKLLGSLKLGDVIKEVLSPDGLGKNGPKLQTIIVPKPPALPEKIITRLDWAPELSDKDPLHIFKPGEDSSLTLKAEAITDLKDAGASTFSVEGLLRNITLNLVGEDPFLIIEVKQVKFTAGKDKPPDLDPQLGEIQFAGALQFVEEMRNFLSSLGKGYGIEVQPTGIEASLSLPLPSISVGVFTLQNISIGIGATIPFTGDATRFRFAFCSRENPFILTVAMFGGGGFFALECGTDKSLMLEISLEFGAAVAFNIGVASGGVEIMAGIYIKVENDGAMLAGFLRMAGELDILGLIRISCEIYLGFEYYSQTNKCIGRAKFFLEIEIFGFITIPIRAEVERKFGGESDPTFAQMMKPSEWTEYCNAYAPLGTP